MTDQQIYGFSFTVESIVHDIAQEPEEHVPELSVPLPIFSQASTMQALVRYLVDSEGLGFTQAAQLLGRSPKSAWASYHQTGPLTAVDDGLRVPVSIFRKGPPLEELVWYLRERGLRNIEIARVLDLSPKTTHTAFKRAEVRQ